MVKKKKVYSSYCPHCFGLFEGPTRILAEASRNAHKEVCLKNPNRRV